MKKRLAIVGATGIVGQTAIRVLFERRLFERFELILFASEKSIGKNLLIDGKEFNLFCLNDDFTKFKIDYAIFCTDESVSKVWVSKLAESGVIVIDNSSYFRLNDDVPLVVPEINFCDIKEDNKIISNPNCSTIQLVLVLSKLREFGNIKKVIVSTYQSVSGAGKLALDDLFFKTKKYFDIDICHNIIPSIGKIGENGYCSEENKIMLETKKILKLNFDIYATTVRVPIPFCHGESVYVEFEENICLSDITNNLNSNQLVLSNNNFYPTFCVNTNEVYVSRIRKCSENSIMLFEIADNLRRGAAFNAVEILNKLLFTF